MQLKHSTQTHQVKNYLQILVEGKLVLYDFRQTLQFGVGDLRILLRMFIRKPGL